MPDQSAAPVPYMAQAIEDYRQKLALTGVGIGQAILFLTVILDRGEVTAPGPLADLRRELIEAQTGLALVTDQLLNATNTLEAESQE